MERYDSFPTLLTLLKVTSFGNGHTKTILRK